MKRSHRAVSPRLVALFCGTWLFGSLFAFVAAAPREVAVADLVPGPGDHTVLSWREGPPYLTHASPADAAAAGYSSERRFLRLATGHFAADFDTERFALTGFLRRPSPSPESAIVEETLTAGVLPPSQLLLNVRVGDVDYQGTGRTPPALTSRGQPVLPLAFPVRLIEGGRFFQKFALHDLEFRAGDGRLLPAEAWLEVSAWPDRLVLLLVVKPRERLAPARASMRLQTTAGTWTSTDPEARTWPSGSEHRAVLAVVLKEELRPDPDDIAVSIEAAAGSSRPVARWNPEELAPWIRLEAPRWPAPAEGSYPEAKLDEWESHLITVENRAEQSRRFGLAFDYDPPRSIIAYVPLVLGSDGAPAGLPVQVSKNWHRAKSGVVLPHAGAWMHGRTWIELPARSRVTFRYGTAFARWGGVPAASAAQLSLVGWGNNGFWDELALGGFGESICLQPARVMRRSYLTDFRPLFQRGYVRDERWAWSGNVGGGDTMVRLDPQGRYVPFRRNVTRYASHGPNLAGVVHDEVSEDGAVRSRTEVLLPRGDDCLRVYLRIRHEVVQRCEFSRLAFFQLGADFYNDPDAPLLAWGDVTGLAEEVRPVVAAGARLLPPWPARGEAPWLSLHGERRDDRASTGQASRGLIVREWRAILGGRNVPEPFFAAVGSRGARPRLAAEIVPPPGLRALEVGDVVEALIELVPIPIAAERYYGPDDGFAAALREGANTWRPVHREAAGNRPFIRLGDGTTVRSWPLAVPVGSAPEVRFSLEGGLGWVPVRLTGLDRPAAAELCEVVGGAARPTWQGRDDRPFWQADATVGEGAARWDLTYNLPAATGGRSYLVRRSADPASEKRPSP